MNYETIKTELRKAGYSLSMIADALGCSPVNVQQVCKRDTKSQRVANAVATALDKSLSEVFPDVETYQAPHYFANSRQQRVDDLRERLAG